MSFAYPWNEPRSAIASPYLTHPNYSVATVCSRRCSKPEKRSLCSLTACVLTSGARLMLLNFIRAACEPMPFDSVLQQGITASAAGLGTVCLFRC